MRFLIIGSGIKGALLGAAILENDGEVAFLVGAERQRQLLTTGLHINSPFGRFRRPVDARLASELEGSYDVVVIATRANVYQAGLFLARGSIDKATVILPLFDGAHHLDHWRVVYPANTVIGAEFNVRARMNRDGIVMQSDPIAEIRLGLLAGDIDEPMRMIEDAIAGWRLALLKGGYEMSTALWSKHAFLAAGIAAAQLDGQPLRDVLRFGRRGLFEQLLKEGIRVGEAHGVSRMAEATFRYRHAIFREAMPVMAPTSIAAKGRTGSESLFLMGNMLRQAEIENVQAPLLLRAWNSTAPSEPSPQIDIRQEKTPSDSLRQ